MDIEIIDRRNDSDVKTFLLYKKLDEREFLLAVNKEDNFFQVVDFFIKNLKEYEFKK